MKAFRLIFVLILLSVPALAQTPAHVENFARVSPALYRGAQPKSEGYEELARLGVKTVVDLRRGDGNARKEEKLVRAAGMNFVSIPLGEWSRPDKDAIARIMKIIDDANGAPVFVHCRRGADRTGTVVAVYRISREKWTASDAKREAKKFGMGWWQWSMKDFISDCGKRAAACGL